MDAPYGRGVPPNDDAGGPGPAADRDAPVLAEPRWPVVLAASTFIALTVLLRVAVPRRESLGPHWVVPAIEIAPLGGLVWIATLRVSFGR